jgi:hypothetical protein
VITTLVKVALQSSSSRGARPQSTRAAPHAVILVAGAATGTKILDWLVQTAPPRIGSRRRDGHPHGYCRPAGRRPHVQAAWLIARWALTRAATRPATKRTLNLIAARSLADRRVRLACDDRR